MTAALTDKASTENGVTVTSREPPAQNLYLESTALPGVLHHRRFLDDEANRWATNGLRNRLSTWLWRLLLKPGRRHRKLSQL